VRKTEADKQRFLGEAPPALEPGESPLASALVVGGSYLAGALVPVLPVLMGATTALASLISAGSLIVVVSTILAFLSGMDVRRRVIINLIIIGAAVGVSYLIGRTTQLIWGISV
jgi:VIT1/CCC1 family predicted Fe2+/Mn2+ transporter